MPFGSGLKLLRLFRQLHPDNLQNEEGSHTGGLMAATKLVTSSSLEPSAQPPEANDPLGYSSIRGDPVRMDCAALRKQCR